MAETTWLRVGEWAADLYDFDDGSRQWRLQGPDGYADRWLPELPAAEIGERLRRLEGRG